MSEGGRASREWRLYVSDMLKFCENIQTYTAKLDQNAFLADQRTYDATLRNLELIGEAATHIPDSVRETHSNIPWRSIIGMRNRLIHAYLGIDDELVWDVVQDDLPALLPRLQNLLASTDKESI